MGQFTWQYVETMPPQTVTLYHGDTTGHVLITLNSKVLVIDFKVKETKSYSFFIDEEFCEVHITRNEDNYSYSFEINKTIQTPLNEKRKKTEKKHLWQTAGFFGLIIFVIALIGFGLQWSKKNKVIHFDEETIAVISLSKDKNTYTYEIDGLFYENELVDVLEDINDFPLETKDEFIMKYSKHQPEKHQFDFSTPSKKQIERYTSRAVEKELILSPNKTRLHVECLVKLGFRLKGFSALADFYFQDTSEDENSKHNENSYKRLIRSVEFKKNAEECLSY